MSSFNMLLRGLHKMHVGLHNWRAICCTCFLICYILKKEFAALRKSVEKWQLGFCAKCLGVMTINGPACARRSGIGMVQGSGEKNTTVFRPSCAWNESVLSLVVGKMPRMWFTSVTAYLLVYEVTGTWYADNPKTRFLSRTTRCVACTFWMYPFRDLADDQLYSLIFFLLCRCRQACVKVTHCFFPYLGFIATA